MCPRCVNVTKVDSEIKHKAEEEGTTIDSASGEEMMGETRQSVFDLATEGSRRADGTECFFLLFFSSSSSEAFVSSPAPRGGPGNGDIIVNVVGWQIVHARSNVNIRSAGGRPFRYV